MEIRDILIGLLSVVCLLLFTMAYLQHQINNAQIRANKLELEWLRDLSRNVADLYERLGKVKQSNGK